MSERDTYDVAIVGAGPAGSAAAIRLVLAGKRVVLIEKEKFPRHKLCGEFISPECLTNFDELGVLDSMRVAGGVEIGAEHLNSAGALGQEPDDGPEQHGLAAARAADEAEDLAVPHAERELVEHHALAEADHDVAHIDDGAGLCRGHALTSRLRRSRLRTGHRAR